MAGTNQTLLNTLIFYCSISFLKLHDRIVQVNNIARQPYHILSAFHLAKNNNSMAMSHSSISSLLSSIFFPSLIKDECLKVCMTLLPILDCIMYIDHSKSLCTSIFATRHVSISFYHDMTFPVVSSITSGHFNQILCMCLHQKV